MSAHVVSSRVAGGFGVWALVGRFVSRWHAEDAGEKGCRATGKDYLVEGLVDGEWTRVLFERASCGAVMRTENGRTVELGKAGAA